MVFSCLIVSLTPAQEVSESLNKVSFSVSLIVQDAEASDRYKMYVIPCQFNDALLCLVLDAILMQGCEIICYLAAARCGSAGRNKYFWW